MCYIPKRPSLTTDELLECIRTRHVYDTFVCPKHAPGRYCTHHVSLKIVDSERRLVVLTFEHMELKDFYLHEKYDDLYHISASLDGVPVYYCTTETMTEDAFLESIRTALLHLMITSFEDVSFF
jgi:hypothetical protein